mgnify:CR=1 FL=1
MLFRSFPFFGIGTGRNVRVVSCWRMIDFDEEFAAEENLNWERAKSDRGEEGGFEGGVELTEGGGKRGELR